MVEKWNWKTYFQTWKWLSVASPWVISKQASTKAFVWKRNEKRTSLRVQSYSMVLSNRTIQKDHQCQINHKEYFGHRLTFQRVGTYKFWWDCSTLDLWSISDFSASKRNKVRDLSYKREFTWLVLVFAFYASTDFRFKNGWHSILIVIKL